MSHFSEFSGLPEEKQKSIIDAALRVFATAGYKKAYISEIATAAGISKALIFYYFGTKKALYFFLVDFTYNLLMRELSQSQIGATSDFFERIRAISHVELDLMQQHVAITGFIRSMYFETDPEVAPELSAMIAGGGPTRSKLALDGVDLSKFMDDVDPQLVVNILVKFTEGVVNSKTNAESLEELVRELNDCLDLLKRHLYKEEYR